MTGFGSLLCLVDTVAELGRRKGTYLGILPMRCMFTRSETTAVVGQRTIGLVSLKAPEVSSAG
jgi:hypothetical protein